MPTQRQLDEIIKVTDDAIEKFQKLIPSIEKSILDEIDLLIKSLDLNDGNIENTINNLRVIGQIQIKINQITRSQEYMIAVKQFTESFDEVAKLQNEYFRSLSDKFTTYELLDEIKRQSINSVVEALTQDGLRANIGNPITDILRQNITSGISYLTMRGILKDFIQNKDGIGALQRYTSQITTDAIHQFMGQYNQAITQHLGLKWNMYVGSNIVTSRQFCTLLTAKRYVYYLELPSIIQGDIDNHKCEIYVKTNLPQGMIMGTNEQNFEVYRGGYNCRHQYVPVAENFVPANIRIETYDLFGIPHFGGFEQ